MQSPTVLPENGSMVCNQTNTDRNEDFGQPKMANMNNA